MTLRTVPPEGSGNSKASQRCLDLLFPASERADTPIDDSTTLCNSCRRTLTLGLDRRCRSPLWLLWVVASASANRCEKVTMTACVVLVALLGLTLTFGLPGVLTRVVLQLDGSRHFGDTRQKHGNLKSSQHRSRLLCRVGRLLFDDSDREAHYSIRTKRYPERSTLCLTWGRLSSPA